MSDAPSALDIGGIVGGAIAILTAAGGGIKYLFRRADRREESLQRKEAELVAKLEARVAALEERDVQREAAMGEMRVELHDTRMALMIIAQEVAVSNPSSPALALARRLLRDRFPIDMETPADMTATLGKLDQA